MRVAMYYSNTDIRIEDIQLPETGPGEILMKTIASGVCGSDTMEWYRVPKAPLVLGHEVAGEIINVGENVSKFKVGDRIVATHHVPCNTCYYCLRGIHSACQTLRSTHFDPGGFSEFIRIPEINVDRGVLKIPKNVSYEDASFVEPLGCVIRGQRLAGCEVGYTTAVLGCGMTGLLNLQYAKVRGASRIFGIDINEYKLSAALKLGADKIINASDMVGQAIRDNNGGRLADFVIVCTGAATAIEQALTLVELGGTVLFFAPGDPDYNLNLNFNDLWWKGINILSSYAASQSDLFTALELISTKRINVSDMVTHRLPLEDIQKGFRLAINSTNSIKVIIEPNR
jgi:L-iditol 2-dehydrogenase